MGATSQVCAQRITTSASRAPRRGSRTAGAAAVTTPMGTVLDELKQCDDGAQGESRERGKRGGSKWDEREAGAGVWWV